MTADNFGYFKVYYNIIKLFNMCVWGKSKLCMWLNNILKLSETKVFAIKFILYGNFVVDPLKSYWT